MLHFYSYLFQPGQRQLVLYSKNIAFTGNILSAKPTTAFFNRPAVLIQSENTHSSLADCIIVSAQFLFSPLLSHQQSSQLTVPFLTKRILFIPNGTAELKLPQTHQLPHLRADHPLPSVPSHPGGVSTPTQTPQELRRLLEGVKASGFEMNTRVDIFLGLCSHFLLIIFIFRASGTRAIMQRPH